MTTVPSGTHVRRSVVVTGAAGFVGNALVERLAADGHPVRAVVRRASANWPPGVTEHVVGDIGDRVDWSAVLDGVDTVIHCAARVHCLREDAEDPLAAFRRVNTDACLRLATEARRARVRRFVLVSSIGVNGAETGSKPFRADDTPAPHSPYAQSKLEAELGLRELAADGGLEWVIVRPPMVYGPGAPGNFARLVQTVRRGWPLPLGAIANRRSFVARSNLVDLLALCVDHPRAANAVWLVSDGDDVSTGELLRRVAHALNVPARLWPVPVAPLRALSSLVGLGEMAQRLLGSLQVDIEATCVQLQWRPPTRMAQELAAAAARLQASGRHT